MTIPVTGRSAGPRGDERYPVELDRCTDLRCLHPSGGRIWRPTGTAFERVERNLVPALPQMEIRTGLDCVGAVDKEEVADGLAVEHRLEMVAPGHSLASESELHILFGRRVYV